VTSPGTVRQQRNSAERDRDASGTAARQHVTRAVRVRDVSETDSAVVVPADPTAPSAGAVTLTQDGPSAVRLLPNQPPGRCTRKSLHFADEIRRLHALGYTLEAIRQALSAAGVSVSRSTVHREVRRRAAPVSLPVAIKHAEAVGVATRAHLLSEPSHATRARDPPKSTHTGNQTGKKSAEAFFTSHEINPLFPAKETP